MVMQFWLLVDDFPQQKAWLVVVRAGYGVLVVLRRRQSIDEPIDDIILPYPPVDELGVPRLKLHRIANRFAGLVYCHL